MDEQAKKTALRMVPYGIYLVGACQGDKLDVFIGSWLMQTSFKPTLVTLAVRQNNQAYGLIKESGVFSASIFNAQQKALAEKFLRQPVFDNGTVNGVAYKTDVTGAPVLVDATAYLECKVIQVIETGDHHLFIAEVVNASAAEDREALTTFRSGWKYGG